jgi:hypothetical protein
MHSHNTPSRQKIQEFDETVRIYYESVRTLHTLTKKNALTLTERCCFVRTFADLGETLTFFRNVEDPLFKETKELKFTNFGGEQQDVLSGFTGFRNKLLHNYVYDHLLDREVKYDAALKFVRENLKRFDQVFQAFIVKNQVTPLSSIFFEVNVASVSSERQAHVESQMTASSSSVAASHPIISEEPAASIFNKDDSPVESQVTASSSSVTASPPIFSNESTGIESSKEEVANEATAILNISKVSNPHPINLSKTINEVKKKKSFFNMLDLIYFANKEVIDLEKILAENGLGAHEVVTDVLLKTAMSNNTFLKGALENKIENLCSLLQEYNSMNKKLLGITSSIRNTLFFNYQKKLSQGSREFFLTVGQKRIGISHREVLDEPNELHENIAFAREIRNGYLEKALIYLSQPKMLRFNKYIRNFEQAKSIIDPMFNQPDSPIASQAVATSSTVHPAAHTKRSFFGEQSLHEVVSSQQNKKAKTKGEDKSEGQVSAASSTNSSETSLPLSESSTIKLASGSKLQKNPMETSRDSNPLSENPPSSNDPSTATSPTGFKPP